MFFVFISCKVLKTLFHSFASELVLALGLLLLADNFLHERNGKLRDISVLVPEPAPVVLLVLRVNNEHERIVGGGVWLEGLDIFIPVNAVDVGGVEVLRPLWVLLQRLSHLSLIGADELRVLGRVHDERSDVLLGEGTIGVLAELGHVREHVRVHEGAQLVRLELASVGDDVAVAVHDELLGLGLYGEEADFALELGELGVLSRGRV